MPLADSAFLRWVFIGFLHTCHLQSFPEYLASSASLLLSSASLQFADYLRSSSSLQLEVLVIVSFSSLLIRRANLQFFMKSGVRNCCFNEETEKVEFKSFQIMQELVSPMKLKKKKKGATNG